MLFRSILAAMSDHGAHGANDGAHGHGANEALGPIDVRAWLAGAIGVAIGLLTVAVIAAASGALAL